MQFLRRPNEIDRKAAWQQVERDVLVSVFGIREKHRFGAFFV